MTESGYLRMEGNCVGNTLSAMAISHTMCAKECDALRECKGYIYIFSDKRPFKNNACTLKKQMCGITVILKGYNIYAHYPIKTAGKLMFLC